MATEVSICNLGLSHLGERPDIASIDPPDSSKNSEKCKTFYPIARDTALAHHPWGFATKRITLAAIGDPPRGWAFQYAEPNDCLRTLSIYNDSTVNPLEGEDYLSETHGDQKTILTNAESASLRYTRRVTDPSLFSVLFINALSYLLASFLAGPVTKKSKLKSDMYNAFLNEMIEATGVDANSEKLPDPRDHVAPWMRR